MEEKLTEKLRALVRGQVLTDEQALRQYSRDQSIYEIKPFATVLPRDIEDIQKLIRFAKSEGVPITARGGGSGTAGSALGQGIVIAMPKSGFWEEISGFSTSVDTAEVSVRAGVFHNDLQKFLKERGYFLPADVTSAAISRIGGNIATKASGPHALKYGSIDRFLESLEFVTADGEQVNTVDEATIPERFRIKLADLEQRIRHDEAAMRVLESRKDLKTASGYNLSGFMSTTGLGRRIAQLLAGSVGTLGVITAATLKVEVYERERAGVVLFFDDLPEAGRAVSVLRQLNLAAIELISRETLRIIRDRIELSESIARAFLQNSHLLLVELTGPERLDRVKLVITSVNRSGFRMSAPPLVVESDDEIEKLWDLRKRILWLIEHPRPGLRALAIVNDVGVPPEGLADFISDIEKVFENHGLTAAVYGHAGNGNLHLRPLFDTALPGLREKVRQLANDVYEIVFRHGGTITAEHGMGRLRAPYLCREWGEALYGYMREVKNIFDPGDVFNPGIMFSNTPVTDNMREDLLQP